MSKHIGSTPTLKKESEGLSYALKRIAFHSFSSMHPKKVKAMFKNKREKILYIVSVPVNPVLLYFLTHNKYFHMRLNIKIYVLAAMLGYFFEKGTVLAFKENRDKVGGKNYSLVNRHVVNKHEKQLTDVLNNLNIQHEIAKTNTNEFATRIYVLSNAPIKSILNSEREIAKRMNLEEKNLSIDVDRSYFVFEIKNEKQKKYYFDKYINKLDKKELEGKELPFVLGICQLTGELIIEDLARLLHLLVAGASGNGKSCCVNVIIQSMMVFCKNVIYIMADFKGNELNQYMDFSRSDKLPYIIILVDEMACVSLCKSSLANELNLKITDLLNRGRAAGIYFIAAMQRPSGEQIDTNIRANLDARIAFRVSDKKEIQFMETPGAQKLDEGEFIISAKGYNCVRFKGLFIDDKKRNIIFEKLEKKLTKGDGENGFNVNIEK